jgi:hypothetical protein
VNTTGTTLPRYVLCWFLLALVAIGNGILRESTYASAMSELGAHQVSTFTGIVLTGLVVWLFSRRWPLGSAREALLIGVLWLTMTIAFEFGFGRFVAGHSWQQLYADYDVGGGRLWPLFLLWTAAMPYLFFRLSGKP